MCSNDNGESTWGLQVRRGQISRFVRGKDRKESLSWQKRMDQFKDRFQFAGGSKDKPNTSDDEETYGPKISGAVKAEKTSTLYHSSPAVEKQKTDIADGKSASHNVGEIGVKRKCQDVMDDLQGLSCKKVSYVSKGEAGPSNIESEDSVLTAEKVTKDLNLKKGECGMDVEKKPEGSKEINSMVKHQRVEKKEKDDVKEEPAHLNWREGYDRVLPEVSLSFDRFSNLVLLL